MNSGLFGNPKAYFFTEADKLTTQDSGDAFGSVSSSRYRVCSLHQASSAPKAIAVASGTLFAVQQDADHFNVIIKPNSQICEFLPQVFCFIYRGIKKSSLLSAEGSCLAGSETSDLMDILHKEHRMFFEENKSEGDVYSSDIDKTVIQPYADLSDDTSLRCLFRNAEGTSQPYITAGGHFGEFDPASFGFEIVLEQWGHDISLGTLRAADHVIEVANSWSNDAEKFELKTKREEVLYYLDPAAFFGAFYLQEGSTKNRLDFRLRAMITGEFEKKNGSALMNDVLATFANKNVFYLDFRNTLNYSLNFFEAFNDSVHITALPSGKKSLSYSEGGWPIFALTTSDLTNVPKSTLSQNGHGSDYLFQMNFPVHMDVPAPELYVLCHDKFELSIDGLQGSVIENFVFPRILDERTGSFSFYVPRKPSQNDVIAGYCRVTYGSAYSGPLVDLIDFSNNVNFTRTCLDQLFIPFTPDIEPSGTEKMVIENYNDLRLIVHQRFTGLNYSYLCSRGAAIGSDIVTFYAHAIKRPYNQHSLNGNPVRIVSSKHFDNSNLLQMLENKYSSLIFNSGYLEFEHSDPLPYYRLRQLHDNSRGGDPNFAEFISLTMTRMEYEEIRTLKDSSVFVDFFPVFFGVIPVTERNLDLKGRTFSTYKVVLRGFQIVDEECIPLEVETGKTITYALN